jgi:hypothetical protein
MVPAHFQLNVNQAVKDFFRAVFFKQGSAKACPGFCETPKKAWAFLIAVVSILAN